jgi:hypothetical protein
MCVGVCWCVWSVCVWWPRQCFVVVFFATCHRRKWCHFLTWRIWHVDFGHRNLDNFSQLEIGHCWDWCWSLILWVWLSVIECDWVCKLTFCNRCASRNASAKMCLSLCVCVFVCLCVFKMINVSKWSKFMLPTIVIFATTFPIPIWFRNWKWSFNACHYVCNAGLFSVMIVIWYSIYKCLEMNKMFPKCPFRHTFWFL